MNKKERLSHQSEIGGPNVEMLLANLNEHIEDSNIRTELKQSLTHLTDLTFALDESSIVALTDHKGRIQYVNKKFCEISKYLKEELIGKDHRIINSGYHSKEFMSSLWKTISSGQVWKGEIKNRAKDGTFYWVNTTIVPFLDDEGKPYQYLAVRSEVTKLKEVQEELQKMMNRVISIQEEERKRFSRELHDGVGQSMFSLLIQLDQLISDTTDNRLQKLRDDVSFVIEDIRGLAWELRPSVLDDLGVVPAIRKYIENFSQHYGIQIHFDCNLRTRINMEKETTMYRVIQEALTNIGKYANTDEASVTVHETDSDVKVKIVDKGKGFIRDQKGKGVGLFSMEERARSVGGDFSITSKEGQGTTIEFSVPK